MCRSAKLAFSATKLTKSSTRNAPVYTERNVSARRFGVGRSVKMEGVKSFGQEFYPYESLRAIKFADKTKISDRRTLIEHIAASLSQPSEMTRLRIAAKFVQRFFAHTHTEIAPPPQQQPYIRLVSRGRRADAQIEMLFLRLAQVDVVVGALARELFYPVCVLGVAPEGVCEPSFAARNGAQLLLTEPILTRAFILEYAREKWNFTNRSTLDRALRVLQGAGLVARERQPELRGHPTAFRLSAHDVSLVTFVWAFYDEFLPHASGPTFSVSIEAVANSSFARTLLLSPTQIEAHCEAARRSQLIAGHARQLRLIFGNRDALVDSLLATAI